MTTADKHGGVKNLEHGDTERAEHPTDEKEAIQQREPHDDRVRERGANTGGGQLRPDER